MDVDYDLDQELMSKFSCLGTTDRDVLIKELQQLLEFQLNPAGCEFFLDMTNWNLQAAVGAYYDFNGPMEKVPTMAFVGDVTIGEGESVPPNTTFVKTWRVQNNGSTKWPDGVFLKFTSGDQLGPINMVNVKPLEPGETTDVSVNMMSPSKIGIFQGQWRMCTTVGQYFGDVIWVILPVDEGGLLGLTQQLSSLGQGLHSPFTESQAVSPQSNPFSPSTPVHQSPQHNYAVPQNSPSNYQHSPIRRPLFGIQVNGQSNHSTSPTTQSELNDKEDESLAQHLSKSSLLDDQRNDPPSSS